MLRVVAAESSDWNLEREALRDMVDDNVVVSVKVVRGGMTMMAQRIQ